MNDFWTRIESLLISQGKSAAKMSQAIGITKSTINHYKNGGLPKADIAVEIAQYLGTTVEYLIKGENTEISLQALDYARRIQLLPGSLQNIILATLESCESQCVQYDSDSEKKSIAG